MYLVVAHVADGLLDWFGTGYDSGVGVVWVLAATMLVATAAGPVDVVLIMAGRTQANLGNALVALAVNVGVDLLLIPSLGPLGAALGWAAAILVKNLLALWQVWGALRLQPFGGGPLVAVALSVACFGVLPWAVETVVGGGWAGVTAAVAVGGLVYLIGCRRRRGVLALDALRRGEATRR
jgi:O-antigen/teichoic acid export membrane protein